jgi:hypothetical protein
MGRLRDDLGIDPVYDVDSSVRTSDLRDQKEVEMYGHDNYEDTWKMIQQMNQERLEEAQRIHRAKLAQQTQPRKVTAAALTESSFSRMARIATAVLAAFIWG